MITRRRFLARAGAAAIALPFFRLLGGRDAEAFTGDGMARRAIFFYFPDGVPGPDSAGEPSLWHATGSQNAPELPDTLAALKPLQDDCVFFRGLSMGPTDSGSHPGGAKKLLTGVDYGNGMSIDQYLAGSVGADRPFRHLYLGAQANHNGASGDKHISYVSAGQTIDPEDSPMRAFSRLFGSTAPSGGGSGSGSGSGGSGSADAARSLSVIDTAKADLNDLQARLGKVEQTKLNLHLEALRELEQRISDMNAGGGGGGGGATCDSPYINSDGLDDSNLYDPGKFPQVLQAQMDLMVQAMACDLTRVGVIQASYHTSDLIMSRFSGTKMYDPTFDMRSHQASHYGPKHDFTERTFVAYDQQCSWWAAQFAYLLNALRNRPEGDGTMLDYSIVMLCTEICDGNTHSHDNMPFILGGRGGGRIATGQLLSFDYHRHGDLLAGIGQAMGANLQGYGQDSTGALPGLLT